MLRDVHGSVLHEYYFNPLVLETTINSHFEQVRCVCSLLDILTIKACQIRISFNSNKGKMKQLRQPASAGRRVTRIHKPFLAEIEAENRAGCQDRRFPVPHTPIASICQCTGTKKYARKHHKLVSTIALGQSYWFSGPF